MSAAVMSDPGATPEPFSERLLSWFARHGRHDLPWQHPRDPYRVWVSEIMLQQTQVRTVLPYFERFMARFPDVQALAAAPLDLVIQLWAGLGYYARARNLHAAAQRVTVDHRGQFPDTLEGLQALPGIGRSTAGAILSQAFGQRAAVLDGNVRRLLARHAGIEGWPGQPKVLARLWAAAESRLPHVRLADYTQAAMDLGNAVCRARAPGCHACPVASDCVARLSGKTQQIPAPKPRRARPKRSAQALMLRSAVGEVWLERRPPSGLWGGLWCLPLSQLDEPWSTYATRMQLRGEAQCPLPVIRHAFTHFDLELSAMCMPPECLTQGVRESTDGAWIKLDHPATWPGMPTPIRRLLEQLRAQEAGVVPVPHHSTGNDPCPEPFSASSSAVRPKV